MHVARLNSTLDTNQVLAVLDHLQRCGAVQQPDDLQEALLQAWKVRGGSRRGPHAAGVKAGRR